MREIVLDTETTGLDPLSGHRIVEVGCLELVNMVATGLTFHCYFNPERDMPTGALDVHGLTEDFLSDKPLFADKAEELMAFLGDAQLVIHNAQFDLGFLNAELERAGKARIGTGAEHVVHRGPAFAWTSASPSSAKRESVCCGRPAISGCVEAPGARAAIFWVNS